ncbi:MAG: helix-turn-helix transcriptional regulator [bacterium]|nr:helix-turn-helix transcriptional regulator [bacterium]
MSSIGDILRSERIKAGKTQDEIARYLRVTRQTISSWEIGRTVPNYNMLRLLAEVMAIDVGRFFEKN